MNKDMVDADKEQIFKSMLDKPNGMERLAKVTTEELMVRATADMQAFTERYIKFASKLSGVESPEEWLRKIELKGYRNLVNNMSEELSRRLTNSFGMKVMP
jgi:uncharacterized protein YaeQ